MLDAAKRWAGLLKRDVVALYLAARSPITPWHARVAAACVAAYALSPVDLIPDFVPVLGYLDGSVWDYDQNRVTSAAQQFQREKGLQQSGELDRGTIAALASSDAELRERLRRMGFADREGNSLYEDLSVRENLEFVGRIYGLANPAKAAREALQRLGLDGRGKQLAGTLSGGWKQRLALGACILPNPDLLLLDEPTAGVDPKARRDFWNEIHDLAQNGLTVLVSTHYMDEAERCHEIAYIAYGELLARGSVAEVIGQSGLTTYTVTGRKVMQVLPLLRETPGIDMVAPFGSNLHVAGRDRPRLEAAIASYRDDPDLHWQLDKPNLEDVFIDLMQRSTDNFA